VTGRRAVVVAVALAALAVPLSASATAPTTPVLTGLVQPFELARAANGDLYYTEETAADTARLSVLRHTDGSPTPLFSVLRSFGIADVGFDGAGNTYVVTNQADAQPNTDFFEIREIPANSNGSVSVYSTTASPAGGALLTSGSTIDMIEPAPDGTIYFSGTAALPGGNALQISKLAPGSHTPVVLATFPGDASTGGFPPLPLSLSLSPDGSLLAFDVTQPTAARNVYTLALPANGPVTPKLIASQPTGRALGWDSFGDLFVFARTYTNSTSTFCADSTTVTVLRYTPSDLASANPTGTVYARGTFPAKNFILAGSSTDTRVTANGDVFFALYQLACTGPGSPQFTHRRLIGVPAGGGVPAVLDDDASETPDPDLGYIGIAVGSSDVFRSASRLGNIVKIGLQDLSPPINWAAQSSVDFNGDQVTDLGALYRGRSPLDSLWYAPGTFQIFFGATSDVPVPGDYNGDGKTDAVIFRPSTGLWYGPATGQAQIVIQQIVGQSGDIPVPGDYDGDGKTDPAIYRPSTGMFFAVLSGGGTKSSTFGAPGDVPVPRDYDGDGKTDFGIYRQNATPDHLSLWYAPVSGGEAPYQIYFGAPGDIPVPGDYNGDKRAEAVIFRESAGLWYGPYNNGGSGVFQLILGGSGDVPVPGYYDANRTEDPAVYHKANGHWFALLSGGGTAQTTVGLPTDVPIQKRPTLAGGQ